MGESKDHLAEQYSAQALFGELCMISIRLCAVVVVMSLSMAGCGSLFQKDKALKQYQMQEQQYKPYKLQNSIEGYREFIERYPKNTFVSESKLQIENLEFAPYEQADSVEGYMEFALLFPDNRHRSKAAIKIEQSELKRYEMLDTIAGYQEYLSKYPESNFAILAKNRLQELEFRESDAMLNEQYGFDLLAYRLQLKRLKKTLELQDGFDMGAFTCFSSFTSHGGKRYFHTQMIYATDSAYLTSASDTLLNNFFDRLFSQALIYLNKNFVRTDGIEGFSFDISWAATSYHGDRRVVGEYYFPRDAVARFANNTLDGAGLIAQTGIIAPAKAAAEEIVSQPAGKPVGEMTKQSIVDPEKMDGLGIMNMVYERDRGEDSILASSWQRGRHSMKAIEKRKNFKTADAFVEKEVTRYIEPPSHYGNIILIWNYKSREKAFWHQSFHRGPERITDAERFRPPAESDFNLSDYSDINILNEKHDLLKSGEWAGRQCFVVESTPLVKDSKYGKRMNWIDQSHFIPLKIEYWDREGKPWKVLNIEWQNNFGFWFWKKATVDNMQTADKTFITIDDVRVNQGFNDADFTMGGLERQKHGF